MSQFRCFAPLAFCSMGVAEPPYVLLTFVVFIIPSRSLTCTHPETTTKLFFPANVCSRSHEKLRTFAGTASETSSSRVSHLLLPVPMINDVAQPHEAPFPQTYLPCVRSCGYTRYSGKSEAFAPGCVYMASAYFFP